MFDHFAWSVLVVPVLAVVAARLVADRVHADLGFRAVAWTAIAAAAASAVNLVAFALKALAELPAVAAWGDWSHERVVADTAHVPWVTGVSVAWVVAIALLCAAARAHHTRARRLVDAEIGHLDHRDGLVVVDTDDVVAVAVRHPDRVVVSTAALDLLDAPQRRAVIAHERAHLAGGHHRLLALTRLAALTHPALWPLARRAAHLAERAADEAAAAEVGDRAVVARAIGRLGLASRAVAAAPGGLPAAVGWVPRRVAALVSGGRTARWPGALLPLVALSTVIWTGECVYDLFELLALAARD